MSEKCECGKRIFDSTRQARLKCKRAGNRLRVYRCPLTNSLHVADADKRRSMRSSTKQERAKRRQEKRTERRKWKASI